MAVPGIKVGEWRSSNEAKRELVRSSVMQAVAEGVSADPLIARFKDDVGDADLPDRDRNGFNVMASQLRAIVERWRHIEPATHKSFERGSIPFSRVYAEVKGL